jgi:hypothetical protein
MAYSLQPDLSRVTNPANPPVSATDEIFVYPQPSSMNYCCRPNTMLYGTAPYMAGKGAPNHLVMVDDQLRPQSTSQFKKIFVNTVEKNTFPWQKMDCSVPLRTMTYDPSSTRSDIQNSLFTQRYK